MPIIITLAVVGFILLAALIVLNFVQEVGLKAWQLIVIKTMKIKLKKKKKTLALNYCTS